VKLDLLVLQEGVHRGVDNNIDSVNRVGHGHSERTERGKMKRREKKNRDLESTAKKHIKTDEVRDVDSPVAEALLGFDFCEE
jgi:hypothetical protein